MNILRIVASFILAAPFLHLQGYIGDDGLPHRATFGIWPSGYQRTCNDFLNGRINSLEEALKNGNAELFGKTFDPNDIDRRPWFIGYSIENNHVSIFLCMATKPDEHGNPLKIAASFKFYCQENGECPDKLEDHVLALLEKHKETSLSMLLALREHNMPLAELRFNDRDDTLLHFAAQLSYGDATNSEQLNQLAAFLHDLNGITRNQQGQTALHCAVTSQSDILHIKPFITAEAALMSDTGGDTPLTIALMEGKSPAVVAALAEVSDVSHDNRAGVNAEMIALIQQQEACREDLTAESCLTAREIKEIIARRAKAQFTLEQARHLEKEKEALRKKLEKARAEENELLNALATRKEATRSLETLLEQK